MNRKVTSPITDKDLIDHQWQFWSDIEFERNVHNAYQTKESLNNLFEGKFNFIKNLGLSQEVLKGYIYVFRQNIPKHDRMEGVTYYDDLIEQYLLK
jgi:hypothetical protein